MSEEGHGLGKLLSVIIGVILLIFIIFWFTGALDPIFKFFKGLDQKDNSESKFFSAEYVGFYSNNQFGVLPQGCVKINNQDNKVECDEGTSVEFYVNIKNIGQKSRFFYAAPLLGKNCEKIDECESREYLPNLKGCSIEAGSSKECPMGRTYTLEEGEYRLFAGAECGEGDCTNAASLSGSRNYNTKSFIDITVN
ncbi:MAG: hypothetical protein ACP5NV_02615 [Candidatus Woesearchaeota archaeon]